jgi:hypothetical protein
MFMYALTNTDRLVSLEEGNTPTLLAVYWDKGEDTQFYVGASDVSMPQPDGGAPLQAADGVRTTGVSGSDWVTGYRE